MLPDLPRLLAGYELFAERNRFLAARNEPALADALEEAASLAQDREAEEPAALFYSFARRPRAFGNEHGRVTLHFTVEHARALGFALTVNVAVLELLRARVVRSAIDFAELRAWFAAHLVPNELEAVLALSEKGRAEWHERKDEKGFRLYRGAFPNGRDATLTIAAAWIGKMGERAAALRAQQLVEELAPACLAMCGICAGDRRKVALGDHFGSQSGARARQSGALWPAVRCPSRAVEHRLAHSPVPFGAQSGPRKKQSGAVSPAVRRRFGRSPVPIRPQ